MSTRGFMNARRRRMANSVVACMMSFVMLFYGVPAQAIQTQLYGDGAVALQAQGGQGQDQGASGQSQAVTTLQGDPQGADEATAAEDAAKEAPASPDEETVTGGVLAI